MPQIFVENLMLRKLVQSPWKFGMDNIAHCCKLKQKGHYIMMLKHNLFHTCNQVRSRNWGKATGSSTSACTSDTASTHSWTTASTAHASDVDSAPSF
jgi:hypothetical protein